MSKISAASSAKYVNIPSQPALLKQVRLSIIVLFSINPSSQLNMDGLGMERGNSKGPLLIKFRIEFPKQLTNEQKSALLEIL